MKVFQTIQRHYATLGICPTNQSNRQYPIDLRIPLGFIPFGCVGVSQFVFIFHVADDFTEYLESICTLFASLFGFVCFVTIIFKRTKLFENIVNMEKLIDSRSEYPQSKALFLKIDRQVGRISEIIFIVLFEIGLQLVVLPKCIVSFAVYFATDSGRDSFQFPIPMWFPFDWNNPMGYLIAFAIEHIIAGYVFFIFACSLSLAIGAFWFAISATQDIQRILVSIRDKIEANVLQLNEFIEFIETHGSLKHVAHAFSDILQPMAMSLFTWSLLSISGALLFIQVELLRHGNVMPVITTILDGFIGLAAVLVVCEFGQRMSDAFEAIEFTINQFDWYLFPIEFKRMLPMIIANAQQSVELECFGSITCSREVFRKILRCAYSYFTVLRQLDH